jgi:RNA-directed DNA polymerase
MNSNRPTSQASPNHTGTVEGGARSKPELPTEQSVSALVEKPALNKNLDHLMERIVDQANFESAWKNVKANRGAAGPDGITLGEFFETFGQHWPETRRQLLEGTYRPGPVRRKSISKTDGGERDLGIPTVPGNRT